jgi:hypothetical protein
MASGVKMLCNPWMVRVEHAGYDAYGGHPSDNTAKEIPAKENPGLGYDAHSR